MQLLKFRYDDRILLFSIIFLIEKDEFIFSHRNILNYEIASFEGIFKLQNSVYCIIEGNFSTHLQVQSLDDQ